MDFRYRGRRIRRPSPDGTRRGAETLERTLRKEFADDEDAGRDPFAGPPPTFAEFSERWMRDYVVPNNRQSTVREKRSTLRSQLLPAFGPMRLDEITTAKIDRFIAAAKSRGLSPKRVKNALTILRRCLVSASEWGLSRHVPLIHWPRVRPPEAKYLSRDEVDRLLTSMRPGFWRTLVLFILTTGVRFGEAAALRWEDLELSKDAPSVFIRRAVERGHVDEPKTPAGRRVIPLVPETAAALHALRHEREYVFSCEDGSLMRPDGASTYLTKACKRAGVPRVTWHPLRHTAATELVRQGAPLPVVQAVLGHTTIQMTSRYTHAAPSTIREHIRTLSPREWNPIGHHVPERTNFDDEMGTPKHTKRGSAQRKNDLTGSF